jgi:hypothetical protein
VTCLVRDRVLLFAVGLILLFVVGLVKPVSAGDSITVTLTASPSNVTVTAGGSGSTTITFHLSAGDIINPIVTCSGLPASASCSTNPNPIPPFPFLVGNGYQFTLTVSAASSTSPGTYQVTAQVSYEEPTIIQPSFLAISPIQFGSSSGIGPNSLLIQQALLTASVTITVTVNAASPIPEYPLGLPVLAIFMIIAYGLIKRRTRDPKNI